MLVDLSRPVGIVQIERLPGLLFLLDRQPDLTIGRVLVGNVGNLARLPEDCRTISTRQRAHTNDDHRTLGPLQLGSEF